MMIDVTDATFQAEVIDRSSTTPVVVDLWAPWCGPCKQLGPILEKVVGETNGQVVLAKVNVDENPGVSQAFQVQGIPAVFGIAGGKVVSTFVGAKPEHEVREFVAALGPSPEDLEITALVQAGDETSLRLALAKKPDHGAAIESLARILIERDDFDEALELLARVPETPEVRRLAALARSGGQPVDDEVTRKLDDLLSSVKDDDDARQQFVDLLDVLGPDDARTAAYRKRLTSALF